MLTAQDMENIKWTYILHRTSEELNGAGSLVQFAWWCKEFVTQDMTDKDCECIYNMIVKEFS